MGYLSCNAESAIAVCDSYNCHRGRPHGRRISAPTPTPIREFSCAELESATNGFSSRSFLGRGSHGSVYRAVLDGGSLVAAVKKAKGPAVNQGSKSSGCSPEENEIEVLSRIRNPRVVNLLGFSADAGGRRKWIVVEFMPNGSLFDLIHSNPRPPGWAARFRLALQVAKAVESLHGANPPVIHRDIKSSNVLLDRRGNARLGDFGLALREDARVRCTPPAGTLGYLDPCYLAPADLTTKSDVFSFGILLLELLSGRNAIDLAHSPPSVVDWAAPLILSGESAAICDPRIAAPLETRSIRKASVLAARCVRPTAEKRPPMSEVVDSLKAVYRGLRASSWKILRRRVGDPPTAIFWDPVEQGEEASKAVRTGGRRNWKVSCEPIPECKDGSSCSTKGAAVDRVSRSRSIGCASEIKSAASDNDRDPDGRFPWTKAGLAAKIPATVRLSKSRSTGILQSRLRVHCDHEIVPFQLLTARMTSNPPEAELQGGVTEEPHRKGGGESDELPLIDRTAETETA